MQPTQSQMIEMYRLMRTIRTYEDNIQKTYFADKLPNFNMANGLIPGEMHLSAGQEPCAVGVCIHLTDNDVVTGTHRAHHVAISKGVDLNRMTAEIFGRASGLSGGRGGHMHLFDVDVNFMSSGIVGEGLAPAVGAALSFKMRNLPHIALAFIGEGAANQGAFHEAMNLAGLWKLPFVCIIEDNRYGISVDKASSTAVPRNDVRAAAYGMPGCFVPKNDVLGVFSAAGTAIERARRGKGPSLIEIETHRLSGHFSGDTEEYVPQAEREDRVARDALPAFRNTLLEQHAVEEHLLNQLDSKATELVSQAFEFSKSAPEPNPEDALEKVFV